MAFLINGAVARRAAVQKEILWQGRAPLHGRPYIRHITRNASVRSRSSLFLAQYASQVLQGAREFLVEIPVMKIEALESKEISIFDLLREFVRAGNPPGGFLDSLRKRLQNGLGILQSTKIWNDQAVNIYGQVVDLSRAILKIENEIDTPQMGGAELKAAARKIGYERKAQKIEDKEWDTAGIVAVFVGCFFFPIVLLIGIPVAGLIYGFYKYNERKGAGIQSTLLTELRNSLGKSKMVDELILTCAKVQECRLAVKKQLARARRRARGDDIARLNQFDRDVGFMLFIALKYLWQSKTQKQYSASDHKAIQRELKTCIT